jgi:NAD(P)-dependent dehydrogenase (short-subunit alcohol dehydrogenase family)
VDELSISTVGFYAMALADYCVSKSGLLALMRSLAIMLPESAANVRINALAPWWTDTPILGSRPVDAQHIKTQPASAVARAAVSCMVETSRHGETVFVMDERFHLVDAAFKRAVVGVLPRPQEDGVDSLSKAMREMGAKSS